MMSQEEIEQLEHEQAMGESFDEKDLWESGEVCRDCGRPLPEEIREEYVCPECGATYTSEGYLRP